MCLVVDAHEVFNNNEYGDKLVVYLGYTHRSLLQLHLTLKCLSNFMEISLGSIGFNYSCK